MADRLRENVMGIKTILENEGYTAVEGVDAVKNMIKSVSDGIPLMVVNLFILFDFGLKNNNPPPFVPKT